MFCPKCGKNLADGVRFCDSCGTPLGVSAAPPYSAPTPTPQYQQSQYQAQPQYQAQGQYPPGQYAPPTPVVVPQKSGGVAIILSLIFPGLGHFYLSKFKRGVLFLLGMIVLLAIWVVLWLDAARSVYSSAYDYGYNLFTPSDSTLIAISIVGWLVITVYVFVVAFDAYRSAKRYNRTIAQTGRAPW